ncbi:PAS domain S-box protein [Pokkaliibacter sp. MBI-7]|uniref:PAS domain-containing sensor histidine kinase n=1 Tax=Pokkaliibacter sp. MBI-7 TaxID=3040600 RepID=UPI00244AF106|nr:PAS domain S-box protein [Pokkaliibacter sp. MBI-7]MDH2435219.1 PAS domain S-box protein [Pokkaliibacter sp. MBI-7]
MLLYNDPQPGAVLDASAHPLQSNQALQHLLGELQVPLIQLLPFNVAALVSASLRQQRAIEDVEHQVGERILLWSFIPERVSQQVLLRGRDATHERRSVKEAAEASRLYRLITENTSDMISHHSPDGTFLDASPAAWTLLGYWPEQLRGMQTKHLLHPEDRHRLFTAREELEISGRHTMTYRIGHRQGHYLWFETASHAIRDAYSGEVIEVVSVSRDVTARVKAEEIRHRLADVIEATTDLVLFLDSSGKPTYINQAARRALCADAPPAPAGQQKTDSTLTLPTLASLLDDASRQRLLEGLLTAREQGVWRTDMYLHPRHRQALPVSLVLLAHTAADGVRYFSLVARDMTERELRESQLRRHQEELAHASRLTTMGELASGIAHEMNQPLAAVVNYAGASLRYLKRLPQQDQVHEKVAEGLTRITLHANHAAEVIKRLRAFLRKGQPRLQKLDANGVISHALMLCQWDANEKQVQLLTELQTALPDIFVDPVLLEQVLINLLRNAIDANRERHGHNGSHVTVRSYRCQENWVCVQVIDHGPGLSEERLAQIFTPFFTSKADGLGLGLSISRTLVEGFGGTLEAQTHPDGLVFECRLPAIHADNTFTDKP